MGSISRSVGYGGKNEMADVIVVQTLLSTHIASNSKLQKFLKPIPFHGQINGRTKSDPTVNAILVFQREILGYPSPAGRVDPGGKTLRALEGKPFTWGALKSDTAVEPETDVREELSAILREMNVKTTNPGNYRAWGDPIEFDTFIKLVLCELNGINVDCNYMVFDAQSTFGQKTERNVMFISKTHESNIVTSLIRHYSQNTVTKYISEDQQKHSVDGIVTQFHNLVRSVDTIKRWSNANGGLADANTSNTDGAEYVREIARRIILMQPPSIYFAVGKRMQPSEDRSGFFGIFGGRRYDQFPLLPPSSLPAIRLGENKGIF